MSKKISTLMAALVAAGLSSVSAQAMAAGFQLFEENGVNMGNYNAGAAVIAEDASTAFYNPAGLTRLKNQQIVLSAVGINIEQDIKGFSIHNALLTGPTGAVTVVPVSAEAGSASNNNFSVVPAFHYALPLSDKVVFGFSITAPFGLKTEYSDTSFVRYAGTLSEVKDIDISPSLGIKVTDKISVGAGVDVQYISAELNQIAGLGDLSPILGLTDSDTHSKNEADDWTVGWHAGVLVEFTPQTRVGLTYHSKVSPNLDGTSKLVGPIATAVNGGPIRSNNLKGDATFPAWTMLSGYHDINEQWAVMGTIVYTQWSQFKDLKLMNVASVTQGFAGMFPVFSPSTLTVVVPENFKDTWRFSGGVTYKVNEKWKVRAGGGYDQDPTNNVDRNVRLPDSPRWALAVGASFQAWENVSFDAGFTHLFVDESRVNNTAIVGQQATYVNAKNTGDVNLLGVQMNIDIA